LPKSKSFINVEDRGYQFSDGVYEVIAVRRGVLIDSSEHFDRLFHSLNELDIYIPWSQAVLRVLIKEVLARNNILNGYVYLQISRGVASRNHIFPEQGVRPALVILANGLHRVKALRTEGVGVHTLRDNRWGRVDIKSISLLPNVLAKQKAAEFDCYEAWFFDDDNYITEGASSNAWIVDKMERLVTRPLGIDILPGVTRFRTLALARAEGLEIQQRRFSVKEALSANEAFLTSTTAGVCSVVKIDGHPIGSGIKGRVTTLIERLYKNYLESFSIGS
jgi:D-alanine transaminase